MFTTTELILITIIAAAVLLILTNRIRSDVVAIMVLLALPITGVLTPEQAFSGFSRSVVFTLIGLFIISQGLEDTGVVNWLAKRMNRIGRGSEVRLVTLFMVSGASLSLIMNNIAAGAMLLPIAVQVARESNVRASKLLIPLSFGTLVGGMATYFTTANIVMSGVLEDQGLRGLGMLDFLPVGGFIVILTTIFMVVVGRHLLPNRESVGEQLSGMTLARKLYDAYQLQERLWEMRVLPSSHLVNVPLSESDIGEKLGLSVLAIWRGGSAILAPSPDEVIEIGDFLLVLGREDRVRTLLQWGLTLGREDGDLHTPSHDYSVDLTEVIIPPRSNIVGKTLKELGFRGKFGLTAVALWREGRSYRTDVGTFPLEVGDAVLMVGSPKNIHQLERERDFLLLQSSHLSAPEEPQKALTAVVIAAVVLVLSIFSLIPTAEAMLLGAVAMILTGCLDMDEAYRAIEWRVIFLIAGMTPISIAMIDSGLADRLAQAVITVTAPFGALGLIAGFFLLTMAITQVLSGQVAAIIIGPVVVAAALGMGVNPHAAAVAAAIACSTAFLIPTGHPVNALMMGPAGYVPSDFLKVGLGMTLVTFIALMIGMVVVWGVR